MLNDSEVNGKAESTVVMPGMVTEEMRHVGGWLKSRWSVIAPEDWLEACLQWLHDDNQVTILSCLSHRFHTT